MAKSTSDHTDFSPDDVDVIKKETVFKDYFQVDKYTLRHKKHEGGWTHSFTREIFERGHAAGMLLYDPVKELVVLVEQFRPGAYAANYNPWLIEIPAGIIEVGESVEDVVRRETTEETGCKAKRVEFILDYLVTPGGSSESLTLYCVEVDSDEALEVAGLENEGENIRVLKVSCDEAFEMLATGQVHNSMTVIALQWLQLNQNKIHNKWCDEI